MNTNTPITFPSGNETISGTLFYPTVSGVDKLPAVVMYHGRGSSQKRYVDRAQTLRQHGFIVLTFDFRGCGESGGKFSDQTVANGFVDALAGYDFLVKQSHVDTKRIGVFGGSFGGYVAALVCGKRPVKSLILSAPATYKDEWWGVVNETIPELRPYLLSDDIADNKAYQVIRAYRGSLLVIGHENDEVIGKPVVDKYFTQAKNAKPRKLEYILDAPHSLHDEKFRSISSTLTLDWFTKTL